jgi:hypothetical protein
MSLPKASAAQLFDGWKNTLLHVSFIPVQERPWNQHKNTGTAFTNLSQEMIGDTKIFPPGVHYQSASTLATFLKAVGTTSVQAAHAYEIAVNRTQTKRAGGPYTFLTARNTDDVLELNSVDHLCQLGEGFLKGMTKKQVSELDLLMSTDGDSRGILIAHHALSKLLIEIGQQELLNPTATTRGKKESKEADEQQRQSNKDDAAARTDQWARTQRSLDKKYNKRRSSRSAGSDDGENEDDDDAAYNLDMAGGESSEDREQRKTREKKIRRQEAEQNRTSETNIHLQTLQSTEDYLTKLMNPAAMAAQQAQTTTAISTAVVNALIATGVIQGSRGRGLVSLSSGGHGDDDEVLVGRPDSRNSSFSSITTASSSRDSSSRAVPRNRSSMSSSSSSSSHNDDELLSGKAARKLCKGCNEMNPMTRTTCVWDCGSSEFWVDEAAS